MIVARNIDMRGFNRGTAGLIRDAGVSAPVVVRKETMELIKTLSRISPPKDPARSRASIDANLDRKFQLLAEARDGLPERLKGKPLPNGMIPYSVNERFLRVVLPRSDMRGASVTQLRDLSYRVNKHGRIISPFKFPHRRQRVMILQQVLTKKSTVNKLKAYFKSHLGRLKAAWLVATVFGSLRLTGSNQPPQWVKQHAQKAKGTFVDATGDPRRPTFTIINYAKGIGDRQVTYIVQAAVNIRAKAMQVNAALFMKGKKKLSQYA